MVLFSHLFWLWISCINSVCSSNLWHGISSNRSSKYDSLCESWFTLRHSFTVWYVTCPFHSSLHESYFSYVAIEQDSQVPSYNNIKWVLVLLLQVSMQRNSLSFLWQEEGLAYLLWLWLNAAFLWLSSNSTCIGNLNFSIFLWLKSLERKKKT